MTTPTHRRPWPGLAVALILALAVGCSAPGEPVKIVALDLTHELDAKNQPRSPRETFAPTSTVYAAIETEGSGPATLAAKWTDDEGTVLADQKQEIDPSDTGHFEFHHQPESGEWALGRYKVIVTLNGGGARTREFEIR